MTTGNNQCFKSKTWTFPVNGLTKADLEVVKDGKNYTQLSMLRQTLNGDTIITFGDDITYYGGDPGDASLTSSYLGCFYKARLSYNRCSNSTGV